MSFSCWAEAPPSLSVREARDSTATMAYTSMAASASRFSRNCWSEDGENKFYNKSFDIAILILYWLCCFIKSAYLQLRGENGGAFKSYVLGGEKEGKDGKVNQLIFYSKNKPFFCWKKSMNNTLRVDCLWKENSYRMKYMNIIIKIYFTNVSIY